MRLKDSERKAGQTELAYTTFARHHRTGIFTSLRGLKGGRGLGGDIFVTSTVFIFHNSSGAKDRSTLENRELLSLEDDEAPFLQ